MTRRREIFTGMGIEFKLNTEVGRDVQLDDLLSDYDAVFLGVGTYQSMRGGLENEDADGVRSAAVPYRQHQTVNGLWRNSRRTVRQHGRQTRGGPWRWRHCDGLRAHVCTPGQSTLPVPIVVMKRTCRVPAAK